VFIFNLSFLKESIMNEITSTTVETTAVAAEASSNAISTLLSSKTGRYAAVAVGLVVASYAAYKGGKWLGGKAYEVLAKRKNEATTPAEVVKAD
jgi:hypothetical protein